MLLSKEDIDRVSLYQFSSEGELLKEIQYLITVFNVERDKIPAVYKSRKSVSAYLYYYYATNIPRVKEAFQRLGKDILGDHPIVEFGAGPGTLPMALKDCSNAFHLIESSELMQESGRDLLNHFAPDLNFKYYRKMGDLPILKNPVLCFTNSFNELEEVDFWELMEHINPYKVIFIEPGTKDMFKKMLPIRSKLIEKGLLIQYPCASQSDCPLMDQDDWCHQYLKLSHDPSIERLTQKLQKDRRNVPLILHAYARNSSPAHKAVLFTKAEERKYGFDLTLCSNEAEKNIIQKFKVLKKRDGYQRKKMKNLLQGEIIAYSSLDKSEIKVLTIS